MDIYTIYTTPETNDVVMRLQTKRQFCLLENIDFIFGNESSTITPLMLIYT